MRRKITFLLTFLVAVLSIALAGGKVYADTGYEVEDYANQDFCYVNPDTGYEAVIVDDALLLSVSEKSMLLDKMKLITTYGNVMFNSISYNSTSTESYIKSLYRENMALRAERYLLLIWITEIYGYIVMVLLTGQLIRHMQKQLLTMCILMHLMQTIIYVR